MFTERYINSVNSSDLRDDEHHHSTDALMACANADKGKTGLLGSLLCRVKFSDGSTSKEFSGGSTNLSTLLKVWHAEVEKKGRDRVWVKIGSDRDIQTAHALYKRVAEKSLAHWLDSNCKVCNGTKYVEHTVCRDCFGTGQAAIECSGQYERDRIRDMVSEIEGVYQSHGGHAASLLRRAA